MSAETAAGAAADGTAPNAGDSVPDSSEPGPAADVAGDKKKGRRASFVKGRDAHRGSVYSDDILQCGYLNKQSSGAIKRWQRRYFEASGHYLRYYESEHTKEDLKGALDLSTCTRLKQKGAQMSLYMPGTKVKLRAETQEEAETWLDNLRTIVKEEEDEEDSDSDGGKGKKDKVAKPYPPDEPDRVWVSVTVQAGKELCAKDLGGTSDPYVWIEALEPEKAATVKVKGKGDYIGQTEAKSKTLNPEWCEEIGSFVRRGSEILIAVYDRDVAGGDDPMGCVRVAWAEADGLRQLQWHEVTPLGKEKVSGQICIAVNVTVDSADNMAQLGETVDRDLPFTLLNTMHRTCFHANANAHHGTCYSYDRVAHHVARGAATLEHVVCEGGTFENKQQLCEFVWHLFFKAIEKRQEFVSGSWLVQDPGHRIFHALSPRCYSRRLGLKKEKAGSHASSKMDYSTTTFGSTHYIEYVMQVSKQGLWRVPHHDVTYVLEKGGQGHGYYQVGVDVDTTYAHNDGSIEMGLFCSKAHLVFGKVPPKVYGDEWLFVKAEHFGTQQVGDQIGHTAQLGKSLAGVSKGPKHLRGAKRTENPDKKRVKEFSKLIELVSSLKANLLQSDLTQDEMNQRAATHGLSYMYTTVALVGQRAGVEVAKHREQGAACKVDKVDQTKFAQLEVRARRFIESIDTDPGLDHVETRFGNEVILTMAELDIPMPAE